jgi:hypothetical protein
VPYLLPPDPAGASNETKRLLGYLLHFPAAGGTITGMRWVIVLTAIFALGTASTHDPGSGAVITVAAGFVMWLASVWLTPFRRCRTCKGTGRFSGALSTWAFRQCPSCGGTGRHRRYFVTTVFGEKLTRGEARAIKARTRRNRPRS